MDIELSNGNRLFLCWDGHGGLRIDLVTPPAVDARWNDGKTTWPIIASATLVDDELTNLMEGLLRPLLRRALAVAVRYPSK
jgi:hypothetical protein